MRSSDRSSERLARFGTRVYEVRMAIRRRVRATWPGLVVGGVLAWSLAQAVADRWYDWFEKRVSVVEPGQLVRGAWQRPGPLRSVLAREGIKTVVTLAAVADNPERFIEQRDVLQRAGVEWVVIPILGSRPSLAEMTRAADALADPGLRPVFFHCVAGHHRTNLALAAYRIRHQRWTAARAWDELQRFPWTQAGNDRADRRLIEQFAAKEGLGPTRRR